MVFKHEPNKIDIIEEKKTVASGSTSNTKIMQSTHQFHHEIINIHLCIPKDIFDNFILYVWNME
ncbi:hypothetical protein U27_03287 [Candidatus Vecturithrix granuli]|uniref:Uncharacterized protein n=1 Tax=Vecturithrix granuli TaxID=1499967 RepID=A0A081BVH0_VECG1|nr:hypothetical protein U27_03287 [Candidatus Vecturithrix granuli]